MVQVGTADTLKPRSSTYHCCHILLVRMGHRSSADLKIRGKVLPPLGKDGKEPAVIFKLLQAL